jgi:Family of unknown function (DUF6210)
MYPYLEMALNGPLVNLYDLESVSLVVEHKSGVRYIAQVAGRYKLEKIAEGVLVPMGTTSQPVLRDRLRDLFIGTITPELDEGDADRVDFVLSKNQLTAGFKVDRERLGDSASSWIWVRFDSAVVDRGLAPFAGFGSGRGALVWPNYI